MWRRKWQHSPPEAIISSKQWESSPHKGLSGWHLPPGETPIIIRIGRTWRRKMTFRDESKQSSCLVQVPEQARGELHTQTRGCVGFCQRKKKKCSRISSPPRAFHVSLILVDTSHLQTSWYRFCLPHHHVPQELLSWDVSEVSDLGFSLLDTPPWHPS